MATKKGFINHDEYLKLKEETVEQSYKDTHKITDRGLYVFSWFGNAVSIFLAYFFVESLFNSAFVEISGNIVLPIMIVFFLSMFELLKRKVFEIYSKNIIRSNFMVFTKNMLSYNFIVLLLVGGSFYLSLSGAQKFMNQGDVIVKNTETNINSKVDSINTYYFNTYISPMIEENKILNAQNNDFLQASQKMYASKYTSLIEQNNNKISSNKSTIEKYELERDKKISEIKISENKKLSEKQSQNSSNILIFIMVSVVIELVILIGIYFDKYYTYRIVKEYEQNIMDTPTRKRWKVYDEIAEVAFEGLSAGDALPSANDIKDIIIANGVNASPKDLDNFFKMMNYLKIIERKGNKRILNMTSSKIRETLKVYYKIE